MPYEVKCNKIHWHLIAYIQCPEVELLIKRKWETVTVFLKILLYLKDFLKMHMVGRDISGMNREIELTYVHYHVQNE